MAHSWTEKYRPQSLADVLGNPQAVEQLRAWARSWKEGVPEKRAVLLHGPPGSGKTSAAHALAREFGWDVLELNASDVRSGPAIRRTAGEGAVHETFSGTGEYFTAARGQRKLIILDEADNLYERAGADSASSDQEFTDRGGRRAILETIARARQPVVLIANDRYELTRGASASFQRQVLDIPFRSLTLPTLQKLLAQVAASESLRAEATTLHDLATRAHGDARSALNDLQAVGQGRVDVPPSLMEGLGERLRPGTLYGALATLFKGADGRAARLAILDLDEDPDFVHAWVDENLPREYRDPEDLERAYQWLGRADVFLGRVMRRQSFGLRGPALDLLAYGVSSAKTHPYTTPPQYQFPVWIRRMSSTKAERSLRQALGAKLGAALHTGSRAGRTELLQLLRALFARDADFAESVSLRFELEEDEIRYLAGPDAPEAYVENLLSHIESRRSQPAAQQEVPEAAEPVPPRKATTEGRQSRLEF